MVGVLETPGFPLTYTPEERLELQRADLDLAPTLTYRTRLPHLPCLYLLERSGRRTIYP